MKFQQATLANGLELIAECDDAAHSTALGFFVKAGSRDENDAISGVSHFLEHMVFKGTPRRSPDDVNREFDEMGADYNAFTSEESTVYHAAVLPEFQDRTIELLGDIMRPSLREEDFNTEKQVIIEEIRMYDDQPPFGADDKCREAFFGKHPLGRSVLGTVKSITDLSVDSMRAYFAERYSPKNITLVGSGKIDFDEMVKSAERTCGEWEPFATKRAMPEVDPRQSFQVLHKESATQEYMIQMANGPTATDPDRFAAKLLTVILGDDSGSRMYWKLVDPGLAEHAVLHVSGNHGAGAFVTYLSCDPEFVAENLQAVRDIYTEAEASGVTAAELSQAKSKVLSRVVLGSERPRGRLFVVGGNWMYRREYRTIREDLDSIQAVTTEQIAAILKRFPLTQNTTFVVGPLSEVTPPV
ncbi:MAG: pitrilysin family protein [Planctomycetota bacterium]|nr:pitrilysin family protein [Planctomycetota bacterium]